MGSELLENEIKAETEVENDKITSEAEENGENG